MRKRLLIWIWSLSLTSLMGQVPRIDHTRNYDRTYKDSLKAVAKKLLLNVEKQAVSPQQITRKIQVLNLLGSLYLEDDYRDLDTSMVYNDQLYDLAKKQENKPMLVAALLRREIKYRRAHDYVKSLELSLEALKLCEQAGKDCTEGWRIQQNLGQSFLRSADYSNAEKYLLVALKDLEKAPFEDQPLKQKYILGVYSVLNTLYQEWGKDERVVKMFEEQLKVAQALKNKHSLAGTYEEMGDYYNKIGRAGKALPYLSKAFALFTEVNHTRGIASVTNSLGEAYLALKDYPKARSYAEKALEYANQHNYAALKPFAYQTLVVAYKNLGNELASLRAYQRAASLRDSLGFTRRLIALADMRRVYEVDRTRFEQQIALQNRTRNFLMAVMGLLTAFGIALLLYSRKLRLKNRELARKKREIEEAYLKGQTTERKRVASELHDNLGGLLSAAKLSLQILDPSQLDRHEREIYDNVVEMMIDACRQVRTLSHNMLPEDLEKQGLLSVLERLIYKLNSAGTTRFSLQTSGDFSERFSPETEFNLYLIGLELCNNVLKHAKATKAFMTLQRFGGRVVLSVTDNGKGLPTMKDSDGMGFQNIRQRAIDIRGTLSFESQPNAGTTITINVPYETFTQTQLAINT
ncbi:sensor histidine kinase [Runella sp.]|uniref:tetratricopeptide repeat-containing sensor histidine kinase n=1 Tax=Runella sp. TaxID=1960881 RepID=UPI003018DF39